MSPNHPSDVHDAVEADGVAWCIGGTVLLVLCFFVLS
jgi:hypothetical protein